MVADHGEDPVPLPATEKRPHGDYRIRGMVGVHVEVYVEALSRCGRVGQEGGLVGRDHVGVNSVYFSWEDRRDKGDRVRRD